MSNRDKALRWHSPPPLIPVPLTIPAAVPPGHSSTFPVPSHNCLLGLSPLSPLPPWHLDPESAACGLAERHLWVPVAIPALLCAAAGNASGEKTCYPFLSSGGARGRRGKVTFTEHGKLLVCNSIVKAALPKGAEIGAAFLQKRLWGGFFVWSSSYSCPPCTQHLEATNSLSAHSKDSESSHQTPS